MTLIDSFATDTITIKRYSGGQYIKGIWTEGVETTTTAKASVQPVSGNELMLLPEGRRNSESVKIFTTAQLKTQSLQEKCDIIEIRGIDFEIHNVKHWFGTDIEHYECLAVKREDYYENRKQSF